jgi:hypothetical protein
MPILSPAPSACWWSRSATAVPSSAQLSGFHAPIEEEIDVVKKSGSQVFVTFANPPKGTNFLDPNEMPTAMEMGVAKAKQDLPGLKAFWSG